MPLPMPSRYFGKSLGYEPDPSGQTHGIEFWGNSFVCGPQGEMLFCAPADEGAAEIVEIDILRTEHTRRM